MSGVARRRFVFLSTGVLALSLLAGCGTDAESEDPSSGTASPAATSDAAESADTDDWSVVLAFNEALAEQDVAAAAALAAPDSPAAAYVEYRSQVAQAQQAAGAATDETGSVSGDEQEGSVTVAISSPDGDVEYTWSDFALDDGLVSDWSAEQGRLSEHIAAPETSAAAAGAEVTLRSAYRTNAGDLYVVLEVAAIDDVISVAEVAALRAGGPAAQSVALVGPSEVATGATAFVVYVFEDQPLTGTVVYEVQNSYDAPVAVELDLA